MDQYAKIRKAIDALTLASMTNHKGMIRHANDDLTRVVREICGLD